ncbi:DUF262 domain-containing HNH endonuclease family protein [Soonwooa sp.]|uniref:DUF262 domain-containing protein n=1 Tax=Soonwooa sp. TaxID=1938592 RepID=UPI0026333338|nr:DUF262 domain-containing HNH endonuclease family protein [Soonwooa sp.]
MKKEFDMEAKSVCLFSNSENRDILGLDKNYEIPIFQRPYSWEEKEIERFLSSLFISFEEKDTLFLGSILLSYNNEIIDGQQRLTTILILLHILKSDFSIEFNEINLNFLETKVAKEQEFLNLFLNNSENNIELNKYQKNAELIRYKLKEYEFSIQQLLEFKIHILENIYFVLIETKTALSKTLKIFDTINTTGMDLNGGDIFKIKMYEYLRKKGENENVFEKINDVYSKITDNNKKLGQENLSIQSVLSIYQIVLISRYGLSKSLYEYGTDRFFMQLFDTKFRIGNYEDNLFLKDIDKIDLSLEDLYEIIESQFIWNYNEYLTNEDGCAMHFIWWSRYSRFDKLVYIFLYRFKLEPKFWENLFLFIRQLNKLFFIYSVRFQKAIYEITYNFIPQLIDSFILENKPLNEIIELINNKIGTRESNNNDWYNLDYFITENLTDNAKRKNLVCRMSAMLEEDYSLMNNNLQDKLFNSKIDIEHIQSYLDKDKNKRQDILTEWNNEINSIGNLMVLESDINRSIGNENYPKKLNNSTKKSYSESEYAIVKKQIEEHTIWDKDKAIIRKGEELEKICKYLFS